MSAERPIIGITMGDAAGIGPEIVLKALSDEGLRTKCRCLIIGDLAHLRKAAIEAGLDIELASFGSGSDIEVFDLKNLPEEFEIGVDREVTGKAAGECIETAVQLWRENKIGAICTAPISKRSLNLGGYEFVGHTEFLAALTGTEDVKMSFFGGSLRVVLLSTHLSLRNAIDVVKKQTLIDLISFSNEALSKLLGRKICLAVAGLNPHASEGGMFGHEEQAEIIPAIDYCRDKLGIDVCGPYSPDTIFMRGFNGEFDAVVALYHDQATIAVKSLAFGSAVNVTLGLPLIRTSVDHGTAYDIAGKGIADASSMIEAIRLAGELASGSRVNA